MSKDYFESLINGSREDVMDAIPKIQADLQRYGGSGRTDAQLHQLIFSLNVLKCLCKACEKLRENAYYDIYANLINGILLPHLKPEVDPKRWKSLLPALEYIVLTLVNYKRYNEACLLHDYTISHQKKWPDLDDCKYLVAIHGSIVQTQSSCLQEQPNTIDIIKPRVMEAIKSLEILFVDMKEICRTKDVHRPDLLSHFMYHFINKRSPNHMQNLADAFQSEQMEKMYKAFFDFQQVNLNQATSENSNDLFHEHLEALRIFVQMDVLSKLQQRVALQHINMCRSLEFVKENVSLSSCATILYNFLKMVYVREGIANFQRLYKQLSQIFCNLLKERGKDLMGHSWFQDFLILFALLFDYMQPTTNNIFERFWEQMDDLFEEHLSLIISCLKLTPKIRNSKLIQFKCCKNLGRHIQLRFSNLFTETYLYFIKRGRIPENSMKTYHENLTFVLRNSIDSLIAMDNNCSKSPIETTNFCYKFANFIHEAKSPSQTQFLVSLSEQMLHLKGRLSSQDWLIFMRRLYKTAAVGDDDLLTADLRCCFIADFICNMKQLDFVALDNQIHIFYSSTPDSLVKQGFCISKLYAESKSRFKPSLLKYQTRFLHWAETEFVGSYYKKKEYSELYIALAQRSQTKYDFITVVQMGRILHEPSMLAKVQNIYKTLKSLKEKSIDKNGKDENVFSRFQELTLGHTATLLFTNYLKLQKSNLNQKDFVEDNLECILKQGGLQKLSVTQEAEMIEMALEALNGFQNFFDKADKEPLLHNESPYISWERILDDLTFIAFYFQAATYLDYANQAWLLHYRISRMIDNTISSLRSLSFFIEHHKFFNNKRYFKLVDEVASISSSVVELLNCLPQLLPRQQNIVLIYLCQVAYINAVENQYDKAQAIFQLIYHQRNNKLKREEIYDIILFTADAVHFRILWKHLPKANKANVFEKPQMKLNAKSKSKQFFKNNYCLLHEIDEILDRLSLFVQTSSKDAWPYKILLLDLMSDFAECSANRLCDNFLSNFFSATLIVAVEIGAAARVVQILCKWSLINLQMEKLGRVNIKLKLIEGLLNMRQAEEFPILDSKVFSICTIEVAKENVHNNFFTEDLEQARKVTLSAPSPILKNKNLKNLRNSSKHKLTSYLLDKNDNKNSSSSVSEMFEWQSFLAGCLRARLQYLARNYEELDNFYEKSQIWLTEHSGSSYYKMFQPWALTCMEHYANFLRATKKHKEALKHLELCIEPLLTKSIGVDDVYRINLLQQIEDTKLEQFEMENRKLSTKKATARCLVFDSPPEMPSKTPASKMIKTPISATCGALPKKAQSASKVSDFAIYNDTKSTGKVRATKKCAPLKFSESSDSSGSEKGQIINKEKKQTNHQDEDLNSCQVIELSDSDCESKSTKSSQRDSKKKDFRTKMNNLKFFENVELKATTTKEQATERTKRTKPNTPTTTKTSSEPDKSQDEFGIGNKLESLQIQPRPRSSKRASIRTTTTTTAATKTTKSSPRPRIQEAAMQNPPSNVLQINLFDSLTMPKATTKNGEGTRSRSKRNIKLTPQQAEAGEINSLNSAGRSSSTSSEPTTRHHRLRQISASTRSSKDPAITAEAPKSSSAPSKLRCHRT